MAGDAMKLSELSRAKRQEFLSDRFVRHFRPGSVEQREKRQLRIRGRSHASRMAANAHRLERFGLDVTGSSAETAAVRRVMRNARKREQAAR
jgi:hypothetical protein